MLAEINPNAFTLLGIEIKWYAIIIVLGIFMAIMIAVKEGKRVGIREDDIWDFILWALPISIVGARLYYVVFDWSYYAANPVQIFAIRNGGLAVYGGLIAGGVTLYFFTRNRVIPFWRFLDVAAPSVLIGQAIGRWGNFTNHEAFGPDTTKQFLQSLHIPQFIIENMYINGIYRQPTFLYESLWSLIGFLIIISIRHKQGLFREGEVFLTYLIWYSLGRFFIEGMRTDSLYLFGSLRISQLLSLVLFFGGMGLMIYRRKKLDLPYYLKGEKEQNEKRNSV